MPKEVLGLLAVLALGVSACSSPAARGQDRDLPTTEAADAATVTASPDDRASSTRPGSGPAGAPASGAEAVATAPTPDGATDGPAPSIVEPTDGGSTAADQGTVREPGPRVDPVGLDDAGLPGPPEAVEDEPSFESEPLVPLDLGPVAAQPDDTGARSAQSWARFDQSLAEALVGDANTAAAVAVSIGGDVVHSAGFGTRLPGQSDPVEAQDRFRIASISKVITAVTLLQLVEDGLIGLDEPIGDRVAVHLGVGDPSAGSSRLTVRQLLTHTSGYGKYYSVFFRNGATDCRHAAAIGIRQGGGGGGYTYSNMNYCVAGMLVEALTGTSYEAAAYEHLLTPLGLAGLRLAPTVDPGPDEVQHVTTPGRNYMETLGAAGAWIASPTDLVTIMNALDPTTPGWKPLEDPMLLQMLTPVFGQFGQRGYGMGMILYGGGRYGHTGTIENTHAMLLNRGDGVIWALTVAGAHPSDTPRLESIVNAAFAAGGFVSG